MGLLVNGAWQEDISRTKEGRFIRPAAALRNFVTRDGSAGPSGEGGFPAEAGRYHLYVSLACPWAHRTLIFRALKKLEPIISASITEPLYGKTGWEFSTARGGTLDTVNGKATLAEIYLLADPHYTGRVSVPVLWDKKRRTIVNNESSEIIRMLNSAFDAFTDVHTDYYPAGLRGEIDAVNKLVYPNINNGVIHDAGAFRHGLLQPFQMQSAARRRLSESVELHARSLSGSRNSRDREHRSHQTALLRQPTASESDRHRSDRTHDRFCGPARPQSVRLNQFAPVCCAPSSVPKNGAPLRGPVPKQRQNRIQERARRLSDDWRAVG